MFIAKWIYLFGYLSAMLIVKIDGESEERNKGEEYDFVNDTFEKASRFKRYGKSRLLSIRKTFVES